jgi:hypothetical protein
VATRVAGCDRLGDGLTIVGASMSVCFVVSLITIAFGFAAASAAIARGFVNGMTLGGGVVDGFVIEGIKPSR